MLWNTWQLELEIVRYIIPDLGPFEETLEGPFLILSDWRRRGTPRSLRGILVAIIDEGRRTSVISPGLRLMTSLLARQRTGQWNGFRTRLGGSPLFCCGHSP